MKEITCFVHPPPPYWFGHPRPTLLVWTPLPHAPYCFVHPPPTLLVCTPPPPPPPAYSTVLHALPPPYCFVHAPPPYCFARPPPTLLFCTRSPTLLVCTSSPSIYIATLIVGSSIFSFSICLVYLLVVNRFEYRHFNPHKSAVIK